MGSASQKLKAVARGCLALTTIAVGTQILVKAVDALYDVRLLIAAAGGALLFRPLCDFFNKIKVLDETSE